MFKIAGLMAIAGMTLLSAAGAYAQNVPMNNQMAHQKKEHDGPRR